MKKYENNKTMERLEQNIQKIILMTNDIVKLIQ